MKLKTRIILGFTMIILMPLLLFAATLYGFSQSQAQKAQAVTESDGTVYDISITDSADSQGRVHVMAKDLFISAFVILISVALVVGLWVYRSIAVPLVKLKKATQNIKEGNLDFVLDVEGKDEFSGFRGNAPPSERIYRRKKPYRKREQRADQQHFP